MAAEKAQARTEAFARRKAAFAARPGDCTGPLREVLAGHRGAALAGYVAMRSEIDPEPAMAEAAAHGPVGVPLIEGPGLPLSFRTWHPGAVLHPGPFGTALPEEGEPMQPRVLIVPLVAFDRQGGRLGYGGGFYDRTLQALRSAGPVTAIGFAFAAQEAASLPSEPTDQPLDVIVTERGVIEMEIFSEVGSAVTGRD